MSPAPASARAAWHGHKAASFALLALAEGDQVLDVGCGTGEDARAIAALHPGVGVLGVDRSEEAVREARARTLGLPRAVDFRVGDACALPLEADAFDASRADRVFHHLADPATALAELVRVTRPGGRVVVSDADYDTLVVEGGDPRTARRILTHHAERLENGRAGRRLRGLFVAAGLDDVTVQAHALVATAYDEEVVRLRDKAERAAAAGAVAPAEAEAWCSALAEADRAGRFVCALVVFTVAGRKP